MYSTESLSNFIPMFSTPSLCKENIFFHFLFKQYRLLSGLLLFSKLKFSLLGVSLNHHMGLILGYSNKFQFLNIIGSTSCILLIAQRGDETEQVNAFSSFLSLCTQTTLWCEDSICSWMKIKLTYLEQHMH